MNAHTAHTAWEHAVMHRDSSALPLVQAVRRLIAGDPDALPDVLDSLARWDRLTEHVTAMARKADAASKATP